MLEAFAMTWSLKLFRLKGIDVRVHATFILILLWGAYYWSQVSDRGWAGALYGVVATLLLFASVTIHEFAHSLQAMREGVRVRDITLFPLGGLSRMESIPENPGQELRITIVGPLTNFALAAIFAGIGIATSAQATMSSKELVDSLEQATWSSLLAYLTISNLILGLFNLIPAFPMDGGRVLRALLAMRIDYVRATALAVTIGQAFAMVLGLWGFATGNWFLVLIAIFVWLGASQEGRDVETKGVLREVSVADAMTREFHTLRPDEPLATAVELTLSTAQTDFLVVTSESRLVGLLTHADVLRALRSGQEEAPVERIMRAPVPTTTPTEPLHAAQERMAAAGLPALPVVDPAGYPTALLTASGINEAYRVFSASPRWARQSHRDRTAQHSPTPVAAP
jgi:Zn-dependent protease/CBS domain-containing protein